MEQRRPGATPPHRLRLTLDIERYAARMNEEVTGQALRDEVDDLVAAWQAQRPDLDAEPLQVLSRVSRLAKHLDRARRSASRATAWSRGSSMSCRRCAARALPTSSARGHYFTSPW